VAVSYDRESISAEAEDPARTRRFPRTDGAGIEQDYRQHRQAVLTMLRLDFPRLRDPEELYQEAWAELLELQARSTEPVHNVRALLKRIAWRRAADHFRKHKPDYVDPSSLVLTNAVDGGAATDEEVQVRLDAATIRMVIDTLDDRQAAVLKLRFDAGLSAKEIQERLGVTAKRLEKVVTEAYKNVLAQLEPDATGEAPWARRQRSLLLACELGLASDSQRRRAQRMVEEDPRCRAMLRQMRESLRDVAAALPLPVLPELDERTERLLTVLLERFDDLRLGARQLVQQLAQRGGVSSGASEGAALGGAGIGAGAITKAAIACLAAGGTIAACLGPLPRAGDERAVAKPKPRTEQRAAIVEPDRSTVEPVVRPVAPAPKPKPKLVSKKPEPAVSSPASRPAPSPAPVGSTEFGVGAVGSQSASSTPAAAPANGGGEFLP
jgi:RNA polymerase sigma factor (sigma-70 family)